ncbi:hypothetical protein [Rhabdothermincola sediminis]|uniref:hypothetical protein n=1 Tax=Rhabdothermincola sediminis TaxID=2751370 RepID=UPI001AA0A7BE|nr:hypothetical protein [Rhabdothermincola sediminis]
MDAQLRLLATASARDGTPFPRGGAHPWRLSPTTREIGRRGITQARQALEAARRRAVEGEPPPSGDRKAA